LPWYALASVLGQLICDSPPELDDELLDELDELVDELEVELLELDELDELEELVELDELVELEDAGSLPPQALRQQTVNMINIRGKLKRFKRQNSLFRIISSTLLFIFKPSQVQHVMSKSLHCDGWESC
jgi:hypothetical protein